MRTQLCLLTAVLVVGWAVVTQGAEPLRIGEAVHQSLETPHPYPSSGAEELRLTWVDEVVFPGASYIRLHFSHFELAPNDRVVVRSPSAEQRYIYSGKGLHELGVQPGGFYASMVWGDTAVVELYTAGKGDSYGFTIDFYYRGFSEEDLEHFWSIGLNDIIPLPLPARLKSVCTEPDWRNAVCYQASHPEIYDHSRAMVRLFMPYGACSGWLVGNAGHVMTNQHCIPHQGDMNGTDFELMAEGTDCNDICIAPGACPGVIEATGGALVQTSEDLDYALVLPDTSVHAGTDLPDAYGFLSMRPPGAVLGERIYHPQHPLAGGKQLVVESTYPVDTSGYPTIYSLNEPACSGGPGDVGYWSDTYGGTSGSPIIAYADHRVVSLHHCGGQMGCGSGNPADDDPNRGVPIPAIVADLGANLPPAGLCGLFPGPTTLVTTVPGTNTISLSWDAVSGSGISYTVHRAFGACPQTEWEKIADGLANTTFDDLSVSGGTTYAYRVSATDDEGCTSESGPCDHATATGSCTRPPAFDGLDAVHNQHTSDCAIELTWQPATLHCGTSVAYNVYRSTTPDFDPGPANLIADCIGGTAFADLTASSGVKYFYTVRAEDDSGNGAGPCSGGNEDTNSHEVLGIATGPETVLFADDLESGSANWTTAAGPTDPGGTTPWALVTTNSHSPTHSWWVTDDASLPFDEYKDQTLVTADAVTITAGELSFWHRINVMTWFDGGLLEYSTDGGTTWYDILAGNGAGVPYNFGRFVQGGYYSKTVGGWGSPIEGRRVWSGDNGRWRQVIVDLADFAGESVHFRWRYVGESSIVDQGWYLDDVSIIVGSECSSSGSIFADGFESGDTAAWTMTVE